MGEDRRENELSIDMLCVAVEGETKKRATTSCAETGEDKKLFGLGLGKRVRVNLKIVKNARIPPRLKNYKKILLFLKLYKPHTVLASIA